MHVPCVWTEAKECSVGVGQVIITCGSELDPSATTVDISQYQFLGKPQPNLIYAQRPEFELPQIATFTAGDDDDDNDILSLAWYRIFEIARSKTRDQPIANSTAILRSKE